MKLFSNGSLISFKSCDVLVNEADYSSAKEECALSEKDFEDLTTILSEPPSYLKKQDDESTKDSS